MSSTQLKQILAYGENESAMAHLAVAGGLASASQAAAAHARLAPIVVEAMALANQSPAASRELLIAARGLSWVERASPEVLFENTNSSFGHGLGQVIFGETMPALVSTVASKEELTEIHAGVLLEVLAAVCVSVMAGLPDDPLGPETLAAALAANGPAPVSAPTSPVEAAEPVAMSAEAVPVGTLPVETATVATMPTPATSDPAPSNDEAKSKTPMLIGAAVALLAVVGIGLVALVDGSAGAGAEAPETVAFDADAPDTAGLANPALATSALEFDEFDEFDETESTDTDDIDVTENVQPAADGDVVSLSVPMLDIIDPERGASGVLNFDFNQVTGEVCYSVESMNIQGPYRSHIHVGGAGVKGGIVVDLGPLDSGAVGCVENLAVDTNAILANKAGHYAELHDVSEEFTIRGQLSETIVIDDDAATGSLVDADGGGASIVLEDGIVSLEGAVPDQATADELFGSLAGIASATPVVNNLTVDPNAPLPSGRVVIADAVFFDVASDEIASIEDATLAAITALALSRDDWILTVVGHTDAQGSDVDNLELSLRRAASLRDLLADQGVPEENLRIRGAGETAPIGDNSTAAGRAENRRIEFEFTPSS